MTEFIRNHDRYLDPPDPPTHSECSNCGRIFDNDDLNETPRGSDYWLCEECLEEHNQELLDELENE